MAGLGLLILLGLAIEYWKAALALLIAATVLGTVWLLSRSAQQPPAPAFHAVPNVHAALPVAAVAPTREALIRDLQSVLAARREQIVSHDPKPGEDRDRLVARLERLAELHAARELSDGEYQTAKARLLR